ncbi:MAG TPA: hypothetical protein VEP89_16110 [Draconibacterium sp.]|nr:hypothetical protein [Draconibacterium sp.]
MKKEISITIVLILGLSFKSFAATGNVNDGLEFFLFIVGLLLIVLGLLDGADFCKKNGKSIIHKAKSFPNKILTLFGTYHNKLKSDYIEIADF